MPAERLFGHLALRFATHPENLATEGLAYLLRETPAARHALLDVCRATGAALPENLTFRTQAFGADQAIPDLVGEDGEGVERLLVEAKFWAGLTEHQPVSYLQRLPADGLLLFLTPAQRMATLWPELQRRCALKEMPAQEVVATSGELSSARVAGRVLALSSWRALLDVLTQRLTIAGERAAGALPLRYRWVAERTQAWLGGFRRLDVRYERRPELYQAFLDLACALICWNALQTQF